MLSLVLVACSPPTRSEPLRHLPPIQPLPAASEPPIAVPSASAGMAEDGGAPHAEAGRFAETLDVSSFQKGNIHTHSKRSDGDRPPEDVYAWYRDHGYNFLALTDHNLLTDPAPFRSLERKKRFLLITGEEVSMRGAGKQVHLNGLCTRSTVGGRIFDTKREALVWAVQQIRAQGGVALINHPNWDWALSPEDLPNGRGARLLEIWSGHPFVHTLGDETHLSHEAIWEGTLDHDEGFAGVAVDDAHNYADDAPETAARPGRGWIFTYGAELTRKSVCSALGEGRLYASNGATLKRIQVTEDTYSVWPLEPGATVEFLGKNRTRLGAVAPGDDGAARYRLKGGEGYVRARILLPNGKEAWTEPTRVRE